MLSVESSVVQRVKWIVILFVLPLVVFANNSKTSWRWSGFYLGAQTGLSCVDYRNYPFPSTLSPQSIHIYGLGTAIQFGYIFNRHFSTEIAAIYFRKPTLKNMGGSSNSPRFKNNLVYWVLKSSVSFPYYVRFFIKTGVGYIVRGRVKVGQLTLIHGGEIIRPVYGCGINWCVAKHWDLEFSWVQAPGLTIKKLPPSNYIGIGAHYLFL
jgi:hypothetical protein